MVYFANFSVHYSLTLFGTMLGTTSHCLQPINHCLLICYLFRIAFQECRDLLEAAEAKAYYGLAMNYGALEEIVDSLMQRDFISGEELDKIFKANQSTSFPDPFLMGYG